MSVAIATTAVVAFGTAALPIDSDEQHRRDVIHTPPQDDCLSPIRQCWLNSALLCSAPLRTALAQLRPAIAPLCRALTLPSSPLSRSDLPCSAQIRHRKHTRPRSATVANADALPIDSDEQRRRDVIHTPPQDDCLSPIRQCWLNSALLCSAPLRTALAQLRPAIAPLCRALTLPSSPLSRSDLPCSAQIRHRKHTRPRSATVANADALPIDSDEQRRRDVIHTPPQNDCLSPIRYCWFNSALLCYAPLRTALALLSPPIAPLCFALTPLRSPSSRQDLPLLCSTPVIAPL